MQNYDFIEGTETITLMPKAIDKSKGSVGKTDKNVNPFFGAYRGSDSLEVVDIEAFYENSGSGGGGSDDGGDDEKPQSGATEESIIEDITNASGDTVTIEVPEGETVGDLNIPDGTTASPTITGEFANNASVTNPTDVPMTLNNTSEEPRNINVTSNGDINMSGQYNNVTIDGNGVSNTEGSEPAQIHGDVTITEGNESASITAGFVGDDTQDITFGGSEIEINNTDTSEGSDVVVNAPNATVTMDGVYDNVEVTCSEDTLILKGNFHASKLHVKKGNVLFHGDNINDFVGEIICTGTVMPIMESGETEEFILASIAAATGTSVQINLEEGMVVKNLVIPSETNCSPKITGVFANGAIVNFDGPTTKFITLTNTSEQAIDINVKANGTIYFAGKYNNINVDGKGVSVSSSNYPSVYGDINVTNSVSSVTVTANFVGNDTQNVNYSGAKLSVSNSNTNETTKLNVNAENAAVTFGGKYDTANVTCNTLTLNSAFHTKHLNATCQSVVLNGVDINDFADDVVCTGEISPVQFTKLTCSPGESTLGEDTVGNGLAFGAFASGKSKWNLNYHTYTNQRSGSGIVLLRNKPVLDIYGPGKMTTTSSDAYGLWVSGEEAVLNIYSGDYEGYTHCLYAENGTINVYGGTFKLLDADTADRDSNNNLKFLVNCLDASYTGGTAHINIYGGKFYEYNPAVSYSEPGGPVNFVAPGYHVVETIEDEKHVYEVVKDE